MKLDWIMPRFNKNAQGQIGGHTRSGEDSPAAMSPGMSHEAIRSHMESQVSPKDTGSDGYVWYIRAHVLSYDKRPSGHQVADGHIAELKGWNPFVWEQKEEAWLCDFPRE